MRYMLYTPTQQVQVFTNIEISGSTLYHIMYLESVTLQPPAHTHTVSCFCNMRKLIV